MGSRRHAGTDGTKGLPGYARTIILLQGVIIAFLSLWVYEEYLNNQYFQQYINDIFRTNGEAYVLLPSFILVVLAVAAYAKIRGTGEKNQKPERVGHVETYRGKQDITPEIVLSPAPSTFPPAPIATPALASAATRVLKRIALGEGHGEKPMPVLEKVETRDSDERDRRTQTRSPVPKDSEPRQRSADRPFPENRSVPQPAAERYPARSNSLLRKPTVLPGRTEPRNHSQRTPVHESFIAFKRIEPGSAPGAKPLSSTTSSVVARPEHGYAPIDNLSSQKSQPATNQEAPRHGSGHWPMVQLPPPAGLEQVKIGEGPIDNPLPDNSLVPVSKHSQPGQGLQNPLPALRGLEIGKASPVNLSPGARAEIQRRMERRSGLGGGPSNINPVAGSKPVESATGFQYRRLPQNWPPIPRPSNHTNNVTQKPSNLGLPPFPTRTVPSKDEKLVLEKRPFVPERLGQHQAPIEKVPAQRIETVLKHLEQERGTLDKHPTQVALQVAKVKSSPESTVAQNSSIGKHVEPVEKPSTKRSERISRPGLNRVEPLPGAADNAWARKLPRVQERDEHAPETGDRSPSEKRRLGRRRAETRQGEEGEESEPTA